MPKRKRVKIEEKFPGVYVTHMPRTVAFGRSTRGAPTNLRPAGAHKQAVDASAPVAEDWQ